MAIAISNIVNIFATPTEVFENIKSTPKWLIVFCLISVISIIYGYFMLPFSQQIMVETLSAKMDIEQVQKTMALSTRFQYIGLLFVPITMLIRWLLVSSFLYFGAILFEANEIRYKTLFAVVVYAELILTLMGVINTQLLYIKGVDAIHQITDLQAVIGLDFLITDKLNNIPLFTFLNSFNVFTIWYVTTLTIGISVITNLNKLKSALLVSTIWLLGVGVQVAVALLSANIQSITR